MYQPWTGGNMDEGWTRWVLEQYEFNLTSIHNADIRAGRLRQKFDAIIVADQAARDIIDGYEAPSIRPEYRGGIGEAGLEQLKQFVADGGTLVTMGNACDLAIEKLPIPVRNLKKGPDARPALRPRHHPQARGRHPASDRLRRRAGHVRLLHQQPVFLGRGRLRIAQDQRDRPLSEHQRGRVGLAARRGSDGRPRRHRLDRHEPGPGGPVRPAAAAPRADARHVPLLFNALYMSAAGESATTRTSDQGAASDQGSGTRD
jgi:hypothetical protein